MDERCTRTQENNPRPQMDEKCAGCKHNFSAHWTAYDNSKQGCAYVDSGAYSNGKCVCDGFKILFRWEHDLTIVDAWQAEK